MSSVRPACRASGRRERMIAEHSAPTAGAARSTPRPGRPDVEDVLGEDGQQRDRAAEQDGEEVERDGAEQHRRAADEPDAAEHAREVGRRRHRPNRARRGGAATRRGRGPTAPPPPRRRAPSASRTAGRRSPGRRSRTPGRRSTAARAPARGSRAGRATASSPARPARRAPMRRRCRTRAAKNGHVAAAPARVTKSSPTMTATSSAVAIASSVRRGKRSARWPAGRARSGSGMNIASPTSPRSSGLL